MLYSSRRPRPALAASRVRRLCNARGRRRAVRRRLESVATPWPVRRVDRSRRGRSLDAAATHDGHHERAEPIRTAVRPTALRRAIDACGRAGNWDHGEAGAAAWRLLQRKRSWVRPTRSNPSARRLLLGDLAATTKRDGGICTDRAERGAEMLFCPRPCSEPTLSAPTAWPAGDRRRSVERRGRRSRSRSRVGRSARRRVRMPNRVRVRQRRLPARPSPAQALRVARATQVERRLSR